MSVCLLCQTEIILPASWQPGIQSWNSKFWKSVVFFKCVITPKARTRYHTEITYFHCFNRNMENMGSDHIWLNWDPFNPFIQGIRASLVYYNTCFYMKMPAQMLTLWMGICQGHTTTTEKLKKYMLCIFCCVVSNFWIHCLLKASCLLCYNQKVHLITLT